MKCNSHQNDNIYNDIIKLKYNKNYSNYIYQNVQSNKFFISRLKNTMTLNGHVSQVNRLKWNDDNHLLASCGSDKKVLIWDINSYNYNPKPKFTVNTNHASSILGLSFIDDDFVVTSSMDEQVHVYNIHNNSYKVIHNCHTGSVRNVATIPRENKNIFWSCSDDGTVRQYDTREKHICERPYCRNVIINLNRIGERNILRKNPQEIFHNRVKFHSHSTKNIYELIRAMNEQKFFNVKFSLEAKCIAINPIFNNYIGLCSNDMLSRVYDRRMLGKFSLNEKMTLRSCIPSDTYYPKHLWNYIDEESDFRINNHLFYCTCLGWSNDGKYLGVTYNTEHVYLYDFLNKEEERSLNYNIIDNDTKFDYDKSFDILFPPYYDKDRIKDNYDYINDLSLIKDIEKSAISAYDNKEYFKAEYLYNNCLNLVRNKNIRKILYCNLAMVLIQRKARNDGYLAEQYALEALKLDPNYYKAVYRRIQANLINNRLINAYRITLAACSHFKGVLEFIYLRKKIRKTLYFIYKDKIYYYKKKQSKYINYLKHQYRYLEKNINNQIRHKDEEENIQDNYLENFDISDITICSYDSICTDDSGFTDNSDFTDNSGFTNDPYGRDYLDCSDKTRKMSTLGKKEIKQREKKGNMESKNVESVNEESVNIDSVNIESTNMESVNIESVNIESTNMESVNMESVNIESINIESENIESVNIESANIINDKRRYNNSQNSNLLNIENDRSETPLKEMKEDKMLEKKRKEESNMIMKKYIENYESCDDNDIYDKVVRLSDIKKIRKYKKKKRRLRKASSLISTKKYTNIIDIIASEELYSMPNSYPFFLIYYVSFCYRNSINAWNGWPSFNDLYKTYNIYNKILNEKKQKDKKGKNNNSIQRINCNYEYILKHKEAQNISNFNKKYKKNILTNNNSTKFIKNNMLMDTSKIKEIHELSKPDIYADYKEIKKNKKDVLLNNSNDHNIEYIARHIDETDILEKTNIYDNNDNDNNNNNNNNNDNDNNDNNDNNNDNDNDNNNDNNDNNTNDITKYNKNGKNIISPTQKNTNTNTHIQFKENKEKKINTSNSILEINKRNIDIHEDVKNDEQKKRYAWLEEKCFTRKKKKRKYRGKKNTMNMKNNAYLNKRRKRNVLKDDDNYNDNNDNNNNNNNNNNNQNNYCLHNKGCISSLYNTCDSHENDKERDRKKKLKTEINNILEELYKKKFPRNKMKINLYHEAYHSISMQQRNRFDGSLSNMNIVSLSVHVNNEINRSTNETNINNEYVYTNIMNEITRDMFNYWDSITYLENIFSIITSDNTLSTDNFNRNNNNQDVEENKILGKIETVSQELYNNYNVDDIQLGNYIDTLLVDNNNKINNNMLASSYATSISGNNTSNLGIHMNHITSYDDSSIIVDSPITKNNSLYINNFYDSVYNYPRNNIITKNINHSSDNNMCILQNNRTSYHNSSSYYSDISDWNNNQIPKNKVPKKGYKHYSDESDVGNKKYNKVEKQKQNKIKNKKVKKEEERKYIDTEQNISDKEKPCNDIKKKMSSYYKNGNDMKSYEQYRMGKKKKQQNKGCSYKKDNTNNGGNSSSNDNNNDKIGNDVNHNIMGFFEKSSGSNEDILNMKKENEKEKDKNKKSNTLEYSNMNIEKNSLKRNIKNKEEENHDMPGTYKIYFDKSTNKNDQHKEYIIHDTDDLVYKINIDDIDQNDMNEIIAFNKEYLFNKGELSNFTYDPYSNNFETDESDSSKLSKESYESSSSYENQFYDSFYNDIQYEDRKKHSNIYVFKERKKIKNYVEKIQDPLWVPKGTCKRFLGHSNTACEMNEIAFWNNDVILAVSDNGEVYFWSIKDGKLLNVIRSHSHNVNSTCGLENYIKIWKPQDTAEFVFDKNVEKMLSKNQKHIESSYTQYYNYINFSPSKELYELYSQKLRKL
ncbi:probable protein, unknown function [Plasmodium sp. gorilla clade G2]|uniref:probable protein, unknown function n=1 Tax=Plasmodium sp. gorilla clade G2 TaxID=880535 RepID=UPI000D20D01C|nr:probable protein, unknown function [Plasmodium sp. gorilla clade G2]SOV19049.1 probable protein, unknown function [Plasmodium sp. gorilla clade G2]